MKIGILILNYLAYKDTMACIESIKQQNFEEYSVLVVDNASTNNSFEELKRGYKNDDQIEVVQTKENLGFAKGNNYGLAIFKKKGIFNVLVINGDTILTDPNYLLQLATQKFDEPVAMIGTTIMSRDGYNQNTLPVNLTTEERIHQTSQQLKVLNLLNELHLMPFLRRLKPVKKTRNASSEIENFAGTPIILDPEKEMLHGAAIFFTEVYLREYVGFYPDTFLYYEEELLALICRKLDFKQVYLPELSIYHKEDASSDLASGNNARKSLRRKVKIIKENISIISKALQMNKAQMAKKMRD